MEWSFTYFNVNDNGVLSDCRFGEPQKTHAIAFQNTNIFVPNLLQLLLDECRSGC